MELVLATQNQGKVKELKALLGEEYKVFSLADYPDIPEVVEDGTTFAENALKKARAVAVLTQKVALADDSGLEVDLLGGAPGVYSARFAGEPKDDHKNNQRLLSELAGAALEKRTARFRCAIAIASPEGEKYEIADGTCEGLIGFEPKGAGGFGYDPLFIVPEYHKTFAELEPTVKNKISHRGKALVEAKKLLPEFFK